jgi:hypothetical protein
MRIVSCSETDGACERQQQCYAEVMSQPQNCPGTIESDSDCRCLGPEKVHDEGELPGCIYPPDPRDRRIDAEIPRLGPKTLERMNAWGMWTLGDLAKRAAIHDVEIAEGEPLLGGWRTFYPPVLDVRGLGVSKLLLIRLALREHGLALVDEDDINQWQNLDIYAPPDDGA